jgi:hypothetical protein
VYNLGTFRYEGGKTLRYVIDPVHCIPYLKGFYRDVSFAS